jgi:Flp pilus assembly protein TadG
VTVVRRPARDDRGSVLVLGLGVVVVALIAVGMAVDASRLFLARRSVASLADGAALRGAHDLDLTTLYASGAADTLPLSARQVERDVAAYVSAQSAANGLQGVRVVRVLVRDGSVEVTLALTERVPLLGTVLGHPDGVLVAATARARSAVVR